MAATRIQPRRRISDLVFRGLANSSTSGPGGM